MSRIVKESVWVGMPVIWRAGEVWDWDGLDLYGVVIGFYSDNCQEGFHVSWPDTNRMITYFYNEIPDRLVIDYEKIRLDKLEVLGI